MTRLSLEPGDTLWCDPASIVWKISPVLHLSGVMGGDWDLSNRHRFADTAKYRAITGHYRDDVAWEDTELFADLYRRRLERDGRVGRCRSLGQLAREYDRRFDGVVRSMKRDGFRTETGRGKPIALPALLIGRDGDIFIGNQGNHRLAIAQMLGIGRFAGRIICRHMDLV